jgi:2-polyprenyl-3-methyl-5-hydroxy-6-metoxy-1,4-benzoquinol methylase
MINLEKYSEDLIVRDGILFAKKESKISYPESGNQLCFQLEEDSFWFKHRNHCIIEAVKKYCPSNLFFDIGGGNGFVAKGLENNGIQSVLIEPGLQGCLNAQKRKLESIVCSTLENASFKKERLPSVGLFDVVEHIEDDVNFLKSIYEYLRDDGFVFITVPAFQSLWSNEDKDAGHYRRYTVKNLEQKLNQIGFKIVYSTYIFSILPLAVFLFRSLPSKLGFNKNSSNADKHKSEHKANKGFINKLLNKIWEFEIKNIQRGKSIHIGGSCFIVAQKKMN